MCDRRAWRRGKIRRRRGVGSFCDHDSEFVVVYDMAVGAGKWRKCCRHRLGDLFVSGMGDDPVSGAAGQETAQDRGDVWIVPDGLYVGGLDFGEAGLFQGFLEAMLFRE